MRTNLKHKVPRNWRSAGLLEDDLQCVQCA
jgi:hypothetical protein